MKKMMLTLMAFSYLSLVQAGMYEAEINGIRERERIYREESEKKLNAIYKYRLIQEAIADKIDRLNAILHLPNPHSSQGDSLALEVLQKIAEKSRSEMALREIDYLRLTLPLEFEAAKDTLVEYPNLGREFFAYKRKIEQFLTDLEEELKTNKVILDENIKKWQEFQEEAYLQDELDYQLRVQDNLRFNEEHNRIHRSFTYTKSAFMRAMLKNDYAKARALLQGYTWLRSTAALYLADKLTTKERQERYAQMEKWTSDEESDMLKMIDETVKTQLENKIWTFEIPWERQQTAERRTREHQETENRRNQQRGKTPADIPFQPGPHKYSFEYNYVDDRGNNIKVKSEGTADQRQGYDRLVKEFRDAVSEAKQATDSRGNRITLDKPEIPRNGFTIRDKETYKVDVVPMPNRDDLRKVVENEHRENVQEAQAPSPRPNPSEREGRGPSLGSRIEELKKGVSEAQNGSPNAQEREELTQLEQDIERFQRTQKFYEKEISDEAKEAAAKQKHVEDVIKDLRKNFGPPKALMIPPNTNLKQVLAQVAKLSIEIAIGVSPVGDVKDFGDFASSVIFKRTLAGDPTNLTDTAILGFFAVVPFIQGTMAVKTKNALKNLEKLAAKGELSETAQAGFRKAFDNVPGAEKAFAELLDEVPESMNKIGEVLQMPKGSRPAPKSYLPEKYIEEHLSQFNDGASRFTTRRRFDRYGLTQSDGTSFVLPKKEADNILASSKGDKRKIEEALGMIENNLETNELVRIDVSNPQKFNVRMPSGNEAGVNDFWIPGGKLPNGNSEAVLDLGEASADDWILEIVKL
jgi:hypothetical protein